MSGGEHLSWVDGAESQVRAQTRRPLDPGQIARLVVAVDPGEELLESGARTGFAHARIESRHLVAQFSEVLRAQQATDFGQSRRNQMFGPNYTDSDFSASKAFSMPGWESGKLKVGAQFFNLFNHPNFGQPVSSSSSGAIGTIQSTVNPPTSILGAFLGGNASPRLIQLNAKFDF